MKLDNCRIGKKKTEWLGYNLSESRVKAIDAKSQANVAHDETRKPVRASFTDGSNETDKRAHFNFGGTMHSLKATLEQKYWILWKENI